MAFLGVFWGVAGILLLIGYAIVKLSGPALGAFSVQIAWYHWVLCLINAALVVYFKGYRGFQKGLSPRIAARAKYLAAHPTALRILLAPLFCMGYFHIIRRKQIVTILMTVGMVMLIILVRLLAQPWRGLIDAGILLGLSWGLITILVFSVRAFFSDEFDHLTQISSEIA